MPNKVSKKVSAAAIAVGFAIVPASAYAISGFGDVNPSGVFADDINWMADTGISNGCGGGNFCPADAVSREQMAAFLHRMSGTADVAPSVNAAEIDGYAVADLGRTNAVFGSYTPWTGEPIDDSVRLEVPSDGVLVATYTVNTEARFAFGVPTAPVEGLALVQVYEGEKNEPDQLGDFAVSTFVMTTGSEEFGTESVSMVVPIEVRAGTYTVESTLEFWENGPGGATIDVTNRALTLEFSPFGNVERTRTPLVSQRSRAATE